MGLFDSQKTAAGRPRGAAGVADRLRAGASAVLKKSRGAASAGVEGAKTAADPQRNSKKIQKFLLNPGNYYLPKELKGRTFEQSKGFLAQQASALILGLAADFSGANTAQKICLCTLLVSQQALYSLLITKNTFSSKSLPEVSLRTLMHFSSNIARTQALAAIVLAFSKSQSLPSGILSIAYNALLILGATVIANLFMSKHITIGQKVATEVLATQYKACVTILGAITCLLLCAVLVDAGRFAFGTQNPQNAIATA